MELKNYLVMPKNGGVIDNVYIIKAVSEKDAEAKFKGTNNCTYAYVIIRDIDELPYQNGIYSENP